MAAMLHLAGRRHRIPRIFHERANDLDFMDDYQLVEIYRLDRQAIFEVCEEVLEMERKTRRSLALPVSLQVGIVYIKRSANHDYISVSNTFVQLIEVQTTSRLTYLFNTPIHAV